MNDKYKFDKRVGIKVIVENLKGEVLLIKEPKTNEWMPGRWGLPGGKPFINESLLETFERKLFEETGLKCQPLGIYQIDELLFDNRTVYLTQIVAKTKATDTVNVPDGQYMWVDKNKIKSMQIAEFTEYFNKDLILGYLNGKKKFCPLDVVKTSNYYKMTSDF